MDGQTGVLVDGGEGAYVAALADLLGDPARCATLGRHARAHASEFTWTATADTITGVLDAALGREPLADVLPLSGLRPDTDSCAAASPAVLAS